MYFPCDITVLNLFFSRVALFARFPVGAILEQPDGQVPPHRETRYGDEWARKGINDCCSPYGTDSVRISVVAEWCRLAEGVCQFKLLEASAASQAHLPLCGVPKPACTVLQCLSVEFRGCCTCCTSGSPVSVLAGVSSRQRPRQLVVPSPSGTQWHADIRGCAHIDLRPFLSYCCITC
jgi:hypothetical protein